jgi:hypothetical protein
MFGLLTSRELNNNVLRLAVLGRVNIAPVVLVCLSAPLLSYQIETAVKHYFDIGFLTMLLNGLLTFSGLWLISHPKK